MIVKSELDKVRRPVKRAKVPGSGRKKGTPNKNTATIREMILGALDKAGGEKYLLAQAKDNPQAFMTLLGKVLPTQITGGGEGDSPVKIENTTLPEHVLKMIGQEKE